MVQYSEGSKMWRVCKIGYSWCILHVIILLVSGVQYVTGDVIYPPFFNAALRKPVTSFPTDATCGESRDHEFCDSSNNEQSTLTCFKETCSASCRNGDQWPIYQTVSQRFDSSIYSLGGCVNYSSFHAPTTLGTFDSWKFSGTGNDCSVPLQKEWLAPIVYINRIWQISLTFWIYNELGNRDGTILDAFYGDTSSESVLRVALDQDKLEISSGQVVLTSQTWIIPQNTWTHVGIQLYNRTVAVFINGKHASPAYYDVTLRDNNNAINWWVGKSHDNDYDPFVGYIQDFRIYFDVLVNRGIGSLYNNGTMEATRIYSHCLCSRDFPRLKESEPTFCVQNPGVGLNVKEEFRLKRSAHALQYVNDDHHDRAWISISPLEEATVEIDLGDIFELRHVRTMLFSPVPSLLTIERRENMSAPWEPWQYYSEDCRAEVGREPNEPLVSADDVTCRELINFDKQFVYSGADIQLDLLADRPGVTNGTMTSLLRRFLKARAIRVTLKGHPFVTDDRHKYHAISEIKVNATCDCNGHGSDCSLNEYPYVCACASQSYTTGPQCDMCIDGSYQVMNSDTTTPIQCMPCDCQTQGTIDGSITCRKEGGQCQCKPHVTGRACETCAVGFFNMTTGNADGCAECTCNTNGTLGGSDACDAITGQCACKENVEGLKCDRCKAGYSMFSGDHVTGCLGCNCHEAGTQPGNDTCDIYTATCQCKQYVTGRNCDQCQDGTYNLQLENAVGCQPCNCNTSFGAVNASCHVTSGICNCAPHVIGRHCDECEVGFFGDTMTDIRDNGCSEPCDCDPVGTKSNMTDKCHPVGGQCECKSGVSGRRCDECSPGGYGFGVSSSVTCLPCDCDVRGTLDNSIECNQTGVCSCKPNVEGMKCDICKSGYYGLDGDVGEGCRSCDCFERGTVSGSVCDGEDGQCVCSTTGGLPKHGGRRCLAYVTSIVPAYGPLSGGTNITMATGYLGELTPINTFLGNQECNMDLSNSNQTSVNCSSKPLSDADRTQLLNKPQNVNIRWGEPGEQATTQAAFTYMEDPIIEDVSPLRTIISGGVTLSVSGRFLNSVMFPYMTLTMVHRPPGKSPSSVAYSNPCRVQSSKLMLCPTPELDIPEPFIGRSRRSVDAHEVDAYASRDHNRQRRQADDTDIATQNNDTLTFYLGFILDGVKSYRNMSNVNPRLGTIRVYQNPELDMFLEDNHIKPYMKYWPVEDNHILILGRRLTHGVSVDDYWIQIGEENCTDMILHDSSIVCVPPESEPSVIQDVNYVKPEHPQAIVHVGNIHFLVGYLSYHDSIWHHKPFRYGIVGAACCLVLLLLIVIICCVARRSRADEKAPDEAPFDRPRSYISAYESKDGTMKTFVATETGDLLTLMPGELRMSVTDLLVDKDKLQVGKVIGQGNFGEVHIGFFIQEGATKPELVALKKLKDDSQKTRQDTIHFLEEATIMKDFQHNNVLSVLGVVIDDDNVCVILPYMENGDLKTFINREDNMLTVGELIHFGLQIASGMCYLADQRFIHRDLACRNVMVNKNLIVKVADFGLSRDIYEQDYYRVATKKRPLPVKWMALESLEGGVWTTKSDVWSYGVVLWELLTRGCSPYPDVNSYDIKVYLASGHRMDRPDYAPDEIYSLMLNCWQEDPERRPSFRQIRDRMSYFLNEVNTHTFLRDKHGQQVPSIASRKHKYLELLPE